MIQTLISERFDIMQTVDLIVECAMDVKREKLIGRLGRIKYRVPIINAYVVEIPVQHIGEISGMDGIKNVYRAVPMTVQTRKHTGRGISIAVLDTGVSPVFDLVKPKNRIIAFKDFINGQKEPYDDNGHGTHVAGIAAGNGWMSGGKYSGIASEANIIGIKILDKSGGGGSGEVLAGLQWVLDNRMKFGIRIVNLSMGTVEAHSKDPLVKAVEAAWDAGIVITVAAGNNGPKPGSVTSPGISRKVVTVGSSDDKNSVQIWGDTLENFSGRGPTLDCIVKPDLLAPGTNIVSCLSADVSISSTSHSKIKVVDNHYLQMSGTSMSTPIVAGAIALLLEKHPTLTPNDVKYMLKQCATPLDYPPNQQGWGLLNIEKLMTLPPVSQIAQKQQYR